MRDEAETRREAEAAVAKSKPVEPSRLALVALFRGDASAFAQSLQDELKAHKKRFQKQPNSPMGAVCFPALILARVAIDRGMKVEDDVYLPVRLLPNWTLKTAGV